MSSIPAQTIPTQIIGKKEHGFPMIENAWDFFSSKGTKTVFISVGPSDSPLAELDLLEMMGCPVHIFDPSAANILNWENVKGVLKSRKAADVKGDFDKEALSKWVLPRNVLTRHELPSFYNGKVEPQLKGFIIHWGLLVSLHQEETRLLGPHKMTHIDGHRVDL
jgi:hypothetical protein